MSACTRSCKTVRSFKLYEYSWNKVTVPGRRLLNVLWQPLTGYIYEYFYIERVMHLTLLLLATRACERCTDRRRCQFTRLGGVYY